MKSVRRPDFGTRGDIAVYAVIALLFLATAWLIGHTAGAFTADPDYQYLMNGLDVLSLRPPTHIDHPVNARANDHRDRAGRHLDLDPAPGTVFQRAGPGAAPSAILHGMRQLCFPPPGIAAAIVFFAWSVRKSSGMLAPALVGLIAIFQTYPVFDTFHRIMPESVLLCATLVLAALIAKHAFADENSWKSPRFATVVGILLAFCVTTKVTSGPQLLTILFLPSWRAMQRASIACAIAVPVFLLPILPRWHQMVQNFFHILTHRGNYGAGGAGFRRLPNCSRTWAHFGGSYPKISSAWRYA